MPIVSVRKFPLVANANTSKALEYFIRLRKRPLCRLTKLNQKVDYLTIPPCCLNVCCLSLMVTSLPPSIVTCAFWTNRKVWNEVRSRHMQNLCCLFTMLDYVSAMLCSLLPMYQLCNIPHYIVQSMQNLCWNYV